MQRSNALIAAALLTVLAGCSTMQTAGHKYLMRGQVIQASGGTVYLCVGTADGAKAGQQLAAYRFVQRHNPSSKSGGPAFSREKTGSVQITEIVDEHYARGKVLSGDVNEGNLVELE
jgi:predicted small secreted protein